MNAVNSLLFLMAWVCPSVSCAQTYLFQGDARSRGMANTMVTLSGSCPVIGNPAGLAGIHSTTFGVFYENYYAIPELGTGSFSCALPAGPGSFGGGFSTSGYAQLRQHQASLSYGRRLGDKFRAGIGLHWLMLGQPAGYTDLSAVLPSIGFQFLPSEKFIAAASVFNPARQEYRPAGYMKIPRRVQAGFAYYLGKEVLICFEAEKLTEQKPYYYCGLEVSLQKKLCFRLGISKQHIPGFSCGMGYLSKLLSIDAALTRHPVLGFNSAIGLTCVIP